MPSLNVSGYKDVEIDDMFWHLSFMADSIHGNVPYNAISDNQLENEYFAIPQSSNPEHLHKKGLLPPAQNTGGIGEFGMCWTFLLLGSQIRVLADKDG